MPISKGPPGEKSWMIGSVSVTASEASGYESWALGRTRRPRPDRSGHRITNPDDEFVPADPHDGPMPRATIRTDRRPLRRLVLGLLPAALVVTIPVHAGATAAPVAATWRGVEPTAYDHTVGGGHWSAGRPTLMPYGTAWTCGDVMSYLLRLDTRAGIPMTATRVSISMTSDSTGRSGIALVPIPGAASIDAADPAQSGNRDSTITGFSSTASGTPLAPGATSTVAFTVTGLDPSETVIVRVDLRMLCADPTTATGNVQARLAALTDPEGTTSHLTGAQTVPARGARLRGATTSTTVPGVTTTTTPSGSSSAPPTTTTTATAGVPGSASATTTTTAPGTTSTTQATEVLGEQAERSTDRGAGLAATGGSLLLALLGLGAVTMGCWFVAGTRRRRPAQD